MNYLTVFVKSEQQDSNVVLILTIFFRLGLNNLIMLQILSVILPYHTDVHYSSHYTCILNQSYDRNNGRKETNEKTLLNYRSIKRFLPQNSLKSLNRSKT